MSEQELVTVFRSADSAASDDAAAVLDVLAEAGLNPAMFDDSAPGVPPGAFEVRVPPSEVAQAEAAIDAAMSAPVEEGDPAHDLDLVDVYRGVGTAAEVEALSVRTVLDANDIPNVMVSASPYPNLPFRVKVPLAYQDQAIAALEAAAESGPEAAEQAEAATEG